MKGLRYRDDAFEMRCEGCHDWWPLTLEFWNKRWMTMCRACYKAWRRRYQNDKYRDDPTFREMRKEASKISAWKQRENDPVRFYARRARIEDLHAEARRERQRSNYWANRDEILAKRRARRQAHALEKAA